MLVPLLFFQSCQKEDDVFPRVDNTTKGTKWTLHIGSPPAEVYNQLQELEVEKNFDNVGLVYRKPYSRPAEIKIMLLSSSGRILNHRLNIPCPTWIRKDHPL